MSLTKYTRRKKPSRGRRAASAALALAAMLGMSVATAAPSSAYVASSTGATADTRMQCINLHMTTGPYTSIPWTQITTEVTHSAGFEWARVWFYSNGEYTLQRDWVHPSQLRQFSTGKTRTSAVLVEFADWTANGWTFYQDWAERADGKGYYC